MNNLFSYIIPVRRAVYQTLGAFDRAVLRARNPLFIVSYHSVANDNWRFSIDEKEIKKQILFLKKHFTILTLETLVSYLQGKREITDPSVFLTFDDGYKDILKLKPFFAKHHIAPALFVLSDPKNPNISEMKTKRPFLTSAEIKLLKKAGWEIGCHSATHANLAILSEKELEKEIVQSKKTLEKQLGFTVPYFAYPRGKYNQKVLDMVKKAKYTLALTMDDGIITKNSDALVLPRIGIDRSHTFSEFVNTFSPSVVRIRSVIKKSPAAKYL